MRWRHALRASAPFDGQRRRCTTAAVASAVDDALWHCIRALLDRDGSVRERDPELDAWRCLQASSPSAEVPTILVSACLLGHAVTYRSPAPPSGGAQRPAKQELFRRPPKLTRRSLPPALLRSLEGAGLLRLVAVCPEAAAGLPIPRDPIRLLRGRDAREQPASRIRGDVVAVNDRSREDLTPLLSQWNDAAVFYSADGQLRVRPQRLMPSALCPDSPSSQPAIIDGFFGKARSPTCGVLDARLYTRDGDQKTEFSEVDGLFASHVRSCGGAFAMTTERESACLPATAGGGGRHVALPQCAVLRRFLSLALAHCVSR
jgi:uncharacterized protein YbbK (DUF523 family)